MDWELVLSVATFVAAFVALFGMLRNRRAIRGMVVDRRRTSASRESESAQSALADIPGAAYVVYNPTKNTDWAGLRAVLARTAHDASLGSPCGCLLRRRIRGWGRLGKRLPRVRLL